jgi:hypothetical protein
LKKTPVVVKTMGVFLFNTVQKKNTDFAVTKSLNSVFLEEFVIFAGQFTCETTRELPL